MSCLGLKQYVDKPTRITKDSKTLIDVVFANINVDCKVHYKPKVTDHAFISVVFNISKKDEKYREVISRDYSKFQIEEFVRAVGERLEYADDKEVNTMAEKFVCSMVNALDTVAPKKKGPRTKHGNWLSVELAEI